ncbi:MAG TPA: cyclase family protein [Chloroflexota bacterium]
MKAQEVAAFLSSGRIVDLSKKVSPGGAPGAAGGPARRYELEQFKYPPGELMNYISMESHISTHLEAPSHFMPVISGEAGLDVSEVPLQSCFGMAVLLDCRATGAVEALGVEFVERFPVERGDIVLVGASPWRGAERPYLTPDAVEYLATEKRIKMLGFDDSVSVEDPVYRGKVLEKYLTHIITLTREIPLIEQVAHLEDLSKSRFLFFGFPARMGGLESFPIRAVAIETAE